MENKRDRMLKGNKIEGRFAALERPRLFSIFREGDQRHGFLKM